jgi:PAS domain S-box-containing protein
VQVAGRPKWPPLKAAGLETKPSWTALCDVVERLSAADSLAGIIEIVRGTAREVSGADGVCFVLRDGELCHYVDECAIGPLWKGKRFPLTACISGWCMLNDKAAVVPDIYLDPRIPHDAYRPTFVKTLVMVPVKTTEPIAAIGSYWAELHEFSEEELALLEALGRATSAAIVAANLREALCDREHRLAMALDAGGMGSWELDLHTGALVGMHGFKNIFGHADDEPFSVEALLNTIHADDRATARRVFSMGPYPGTDVEYRVLRPDGERRIEMRGSIIRDVNGQPVKLSGIVRDVTERLQVRKKLETLRAEMTRNARFNDLGYMASTLALELNEPLAAASNCIHAAEWLLDKNVEQALKAIRKAEVHFVRAKNIIQRIRNSLGPGEPPKTAESVPTVIEDSVGLAQTMPRWRSIPVRLQFEDRLPLAKINKMQIQQVMLNLLHNAFEAVEPRRDQQVTVSVRHYDGRIEIRISDNGPGLTPGIAKHLFEPFYTTKLGSMGVGLSLCRRIVQAHDGHVWHEPGKPGATFCFTVPVVA